MTMKVKPSTRRVMDLPSGRRLDFSSAPLVMGIINCTPDSFYAGSRCPDRTEALRLADHMIAAGADLLDIGGESSRPGSEYLDEDEELKRVIPVIREIRQRSDILLSLDTRKERVAREALDAGADMINDISALASDEKLAHLAADRGVPVVLMHMKGTPKTMQNKPEYDDPVQEIILELEQRIQGALDRGVKAEQIIIDPGIGFGKRLEDNLAILRNLKAFRALGFPLLLGASRKSFIGAVLRKEDRDRLAGTLAVHAWAFFQGIDILRVHDVEETMDLLTLLRAIQGDQ